MTLDIDRRKGHLRGERGRFTRGGARYSADFAGSETLAVGFVRSTYGRARLRGVDLTRVRASPGIFAAFDHDDVSGHVAPLPVRYGPGKTYDWHLLADDAVSFVGEPIALVVGVNRGAVEEACEVAAINYEPLDPVIGVDLAQVEGAELVRPEVGSNVLFAAARHAGDVGASLESAEVIVERTFHLARQSACPLENRGVVAFEEPFSGDLVICTSTQIPHILRVAVATVLTRPEESVRVLVPDVGGGFGLKCQVAAEECLVAWVAQHLGCRAAWLEDRWENLVGSNHAHDEWVRLRVGFTTDGEITAVDADVTVDVGAHSSYPLSAALEPSSVAAHLFGSYRVPASHLAFRGVATNKCPSGAYRGVGGSVANFATERILDEAARALGVSRIDIRRRNLLGMADMPYRHPIGGLIDVGDPRGLFDRLLQRVQDETPTLAALDATDARFQPGDSGALVGVGLSVFAEHSSPGSAIYRGRGVTEVPGYDAARVELRDDGTFIVFVSSADAGQRHAEICRHQVAEALGVDSEGVSVVEGDTARCPKGTGTFASRFAVAQLSAALRASTRMSERLVEVAASFLSCDVEEVKRDEMSFVSGAGGASVTVKELAHWLYFPDGARTGRVFEVPVVESGYWDGGPTFPNCAMLAVVEVDAETFVSKVTRVVAVEDCGRVLDEAAVLGQLRGGIVMGIGDATLEEHLYSPEGEILTASFMDYLLPTVGEMPTFELTLVNDERLYSARSESGAKGVGEAGTIGAVGAVGCALASAIRSRGGILDSLPGTPLRLFDACSSRLEKGTVGR